MPRSLYKGPFFFYKLLNKTKNKNDYKPIKLWSRSSVILPEFVGHNFELHNGKSFVSIKVSEEMIGHKFGEFASTRKFGKHKMKKGKK